MAKTTKTVYCSNESCSVYKSGKGLRVTADEEKFRHSMPNCPKCGCRMTIFASVRW